jgi:hypothetical protein
MPRFVILPGHAPISIPRAGVTLVVINDAVGQPLHPLALLHPRHVQQGCTIQEICNASAALNRAALFSLQKSDPKLPAASIGRR